MNQAILPRGQVRIYACGGGGLNIGQQLEKHREDTEAGFANLSVTYVDTSRSNLRPSIDAAYCYMLEGLDGSGKVRSENHTLINKHTESILEKFPPMDLNVVLHTAAGGSGSVIAPLLVSSLLEDDKPVIVIAVGSADTRLDAENTLKTLKSYESIARLRDAPVVMFYVQNGNGTSREDADHRVRKVIMSLCLLYSRENRELDSRDLRNFLRFSDKVTSFGAQLTSLSLVEKTNDFSNIELGNIISVATLANEGESTSLSKLPEYQCVGFLPEAVVKEVHERVPLHFITSDGIFTHVAAYLSELLTQVDASKTKRNNSKGVLSATDNAADSGLVL